MIEWLKLTFFRNVNRKRLGILICFWHESQNLINCFKTDRSISWFDRFRRFFNFLTEKWSKRLCSLRNSISIKKQKLQLKNSMMQFCRTLFHNKKNARIDELRKWLIFSESKYRWCYYNKHSIDRNQLNIAKKTYQFWQHKIWSDQ